MEWKLKREKFSATQSKVDERKEERKKKLIRTWLYTCCIQVMPTLKCGYLCNFNEMPN